MNKFFLSVLSSWSVLPNITFGNTYDFGEFEQCIHIHERTESNEIGIINGQHCMVQLYSKTNRLIPREPEQSLFNMGWKHLDTRSGISVCLPASCSTDYVSGIVKNILNGSDLNIATDYNQTEYCKTSEGPNFDAFKYTLLGIVVFLVLAAFISTILDLRTKNINRWLKPFSIYTNGKNLINITEDSSPDAINCLHGIRTISTFWIMLCHCYYLRSPFPLEDLNQPKEINSSLIPATLHVFTLAVDTFFVISAALTTRTILQELDK